MRMFIKFFSAALMIAALVLASCSKERGDTSFEDDQGSNKIEQVLAKSRLKQKKEEPIMSKENLEKIQRSIEVLSQMEYPIKDIYDFEKKIRFFDTFLFKTFEKSYAKTDFPLNSFQEAFKVHYYKNPAFGPIRPIFPELPSLYPDLPEEPRDAPSVCEVLKNSDFSPAAKDCGCRTYSAAIQGGLNHYQATIEAVFAAINYDRGRGCSLDNLP
ncbi:hypothetical protein FEE95_09345 [Maribacter algarum]|uniref:Lipoprotein n=1 Tax=Maribacter algarum (ex Zhang et al. 2020) TaxID=2578118 RepID=A0A5S3PUT0_9FLAO|nr:hypothetical protein [Maribacter algarum]TMM56698.1 hypothetical protein FEE95_09345 [Maribacter algarum]